MIKHLGINHSALPVKDLNRALDFYINVLGFKPYHTSSKDWAMVYYQATTLSLVPYFSVESKKIVKASHPAHLGITVENDQQVDEFFNYLKEQGVVHLKSPTKHRDGSYGFYFKDSEGNQLEVVFIPRLEN